MYSNEKTEIKKLRNEVQGLRDELAKMKRFFEDILYNLDTDNFGSRFVKEQGEMRTAIEVTANGIKTKVSKEDLDKKLEQYTSVSQTYEAIESVASKVVDLNDATKIFYELYEEINPENDFTNENLIYAATVTDTGDRHGKVLSVTYYYYNDTVKKWQTLSGNTIYTIFKQTNEGFEFLGNVLIDGDLITKGTISAERIDTENLSCTRLYAKNNIDGYSARLNGNFGDFGIFKPSAGNDAQSNDPSCIFGVYNEVPNINFYSSGHNFMGLDVDTKTIWVKGSWNFSNCEEVIGLDQFVSGGSGGVAVFG